MLTQLTLRLTPTDNAAIVRIATTLRLDHGRAFVTRTDAIRYALEVAAKDATMTPTA
jgi:hypothetical protein